MQLLLKCKVRSHWKRRKLLDLKTFLAMKMLCILLMVASLNLPAREFSQGITITLKNAPLENFIRIVEQQSSYSFVYSKEAIEQSKPVTIEVKNETLENVLKTVFANQPLSYSFNEKFIIIKTNAKKKDDIPSATEIRGKVTNENDDPLPGVTVFAQMSNKGSSTNERGEFVLSDVSYNDVLIITSVGYFKEEILVNGQTYFAIRMRTSVRTLDETVVIAYGTTTTRLNTGSVSKISGEEIRKQPVSNLLAALEARVPGMVVTQSTGLPGSSIQVQIRGRTALDLSLTDDQPLFVIDGVPYAPNNGYLNTLRSALGIPSTSTGIVSPGGLSPFSSISPSDIESIEVLKDADATAIYGSRGANGVILITTKKSKPGKTTFNVNVQGGFSKITRSMDFFSTQQYLDARHEAFRNDAVTPTPANAFDLLVWDTTRYTDFKKLLIGETAHFSDVQASVSGGNLNTVFLLGMGYHSETTVFPGDMKDQRGAIHINLNHTTQDQKFRVQLSGNYNVDNNNLISTDLTSYINVPPNLQVYDPSGNLAWNEGGFVHDILNPLALLDQEYSAKTDNLISNLQLSYKPNKQITLRLNAGFNNVSVNESKMVPYSSQNPLQNPVRSASFGLNSFKSWIIEPQAEYIENIFKGKTNIVVGATFQKQTNEISSFDGSGYVSDDLLGSLNGASSIRGSKSFSQYNYEAIFGRLNYNWENKYLVNFSVRRDGSSKFGPDKQFANFGAVGIAWLFTNEGFFKKKPLFISFGKIRGSYGKTGNDKIANYLYLDTWTPTSNSYQNGSGLAPTRLFNPDYHWEKTTKLEVALDLGFFKDRLLVSAAYYHHQSSNQLVQYKLPTTAGFTSVIRNLPALVQNSGFEFSLSSVNIKMKNFSWTTTANLTIPKNELVSFPGLSTSPYALQYVEGQSLNVIYAYKYIGVDATKGLYKVEDLNKDNTITTADYQALGNLDPKYFGGLQNTIEYKRLQFDFFFQFVSQLGKTYFSNASNPEGFRYNLPMMTLDHWRKQGDITTIQRFTQGTNQAAYKSWVNEFRRSDGVFGDASFIRLKNISLSYTILNNAKAGTLRFYMAAQNLFTITNYKGGDPETQSYLRMPPLRTFSTGIQYTF
jgi:TonB-linked SusC/RagA family outer membrane protein